MLKRAAGIGGVRVFFDAESGRKSFALDPPEASLDVLHCLGEERVSPPVHLKYRPDIDGLRAIAVLSVVGFHAFPELVRSGFIGVDVFFVISGFLISTIIFSGLEGGEFNFLGFYSRRVKRIFPALLVVLLASYVFGWFALLASEYRQLGKHIAGGLALFRTLSSGERQAISTAQQTASLCCICGHWGLKSSFILFGHCFYGLCGRKSSIYSPQYSWYSVFRFF